MYNDKYQDWSELGSYVQFSSKKNQGQQGPQKLSSIIPISVFALLQPSEMASLSNSRWQNRIERPNQPKTTELCSKKLNVT